MLSKQSYFKVSILTILLLLMCVLALTSVAELSDQVDMDGDQVSDDIDCAPADPSKYQNQAYVDLDGDGIGDNGVLVVTDCFGEVPGNGFTLNWFEDDNCMGVYNPDQSDIDQDGLGDLCDSDIDGDGTENLSDCAAVDQNRWRNLAYPDNDLDGYADTLNVEVVACFGNVPEVGFVITAGVDNCPNLPNPDQFDANQNGIGDSCEAGVIFPINHEDEWRGGDESDSVFLFQNALPEIDLYPYTSGIEFRCELEQADFFRVTVRKSRGGIVKKRRSQEGSLTIRRLERGKYRVLCIGKRRTEDGVLKSKVSRERVKVLKDNTLRIY